jgi:protein-S-isoprenylcysteine O-methyltransferase Ste14
MNETVARILLVSLWAALAAIRIYYIRLGGGFSKDEARKSTKAREGVAIVVVRLLMVPWLLAVVLYVVAPHRLAELQLDLPGALRWLGVGLWLVSLGLLLWVHRALGRNFSGLLRTRADHELVTWGPYRWVRHPMYPTFLLLAIGMFLLTAHWLIGLPPLLGVALVMAFRTPREEAMMVERFGDEYRRYADGVDRYLPRLQARRTGASAARP